MDTFGQRLSKAREKVGLSQAELASRVSIGKSTLSMYELDKREPNFEITKRIAKELGVSAAYLMGETDDPVPLDEKKTPSGDVYYKNYESLSEEDKQKALEYIEYLHHLAKIHNEKENNSKDEK